MVRLIAALLSLLLLGERVQAEDSGRPVYVDSAGVIRWRASNDEVRLFGANYCAFSGSDYRMAGLLKVDRKVMIAQDLAHFARMGWTGLRLCSWGDWENADQSGNLIQNEHSDLMDFVIAKAHEHGISVLLTPIHTYDPAFADQIGAAKKAAGFSSLYPRPVLGTDPKAIAAERTYIRQVLLHVNPYTGLALKDDPSILFVEMINEPVHHPEDSAGSISYIDGLVDAVRGTGSEQITFFNYSQDFRIGEAIRQSTVQGVDFGWYPSGLGAGRTLEGNFLQAVDHYPDMLRPEVAHRPRIVYEFDQADLVTAYMLPAMARTFRSVGAQFAAVFAYDMLPTAPYNLGWQTHFINLVHTPRQAVGAVIAAEAMRRLPAYQDYGSYPESTRFGDFHVSYEGDLAELNAPDAYMNAGDTGTAPRQPSALTRVVGFGSSPLVKYEGTGAYFLDKVAQGIWRLEIYPDQVQVAEPFAQPQPGRVVSRLYDRKWPMTVTLPDLGGNYFATPLIVPSDPAAPPRQARQGTIVAEPGIWLLSERGTVDLAQLPAEINRVGFRDYFVNAPQTYPDLIQTLAPAEFVSGAPVEISGRVVSAQQPDSVSLLIRPAGARGFARTVPMVRLRGYDYGASLKAGDLAPGFYDYVIVATRNGESTTFPGGLTGRPGEWPFAAGEVWHFRITPPEAPLEIFNPQRDVRLLSFARPDEEHRTPYFHLIPGETSDEAAFDFAVPELGPNTPQLYAAALYVGDALAARGAEAGRADALTVRFKASGGSRKTLDLLLIEKDGSSWRGSAVAGSDWSTARIALQSLEFSRSLLIPTPFPGLWDYWRDGPSARAGGRIHPQDVERLELRVRRNIGETLADDAAGVDIESVRLEFSK